MSSSMCAGTNQTTKHISGRARRSPIAVCRWNNRYITPTMGSLLDQEMQIPGVLALQLCKSSDPSPDACIDKKRKTGHLLWNNDWLKVLPDIELSWWAPFHWFLYLPSHYVSEKKKTTPLTNKTRVRLKKVRPELLQVGTCMLYKKEQYYSRPVVRYNGPFRPLPALLQGSAKWSREYLLSHSVVPPDWQALDATVVEHRAKWERIQLVKGTRATVVHLLFTVSMRRHWILIDPTESLNNSWVGVRRGKSGLARPWVDRVLAPDALHSLRIISSRRHCGQFIFLKITVMTHNHHVGTMTNEDRINRPYRPHIR